MSYYDEKPSSGGIMTEKKKCVWFSEDNNSFWESSCGKASFEFNEGGPFENRFKFCPHCGAILEEKKVKL